MDRRACVVAAAGAIGTAAAAAATLAYASKPRRVNKAGKFGPPPPPSSGGKMKKLFLSKPHADDMGKVEIKVEVVDIPEPKRGEVLVRMMAAPVNPSDYGEWRDARAAAGPFPKPIGKEGSGVVVASGGGFVANRLVGKPVGVMAANVGTHAEYVCVDAVKQAFPLGNHGVDTVDAASFFINPYTALSILDTASSYTGSKVKALVHTAAASQLGRMMVKVAPTLGMTVVNVVRRKEQVDLLKGLGAEYVVCQSDEDWEDQLRAMIKKLDISVAFDAIGGEMSGTLLSLLPNGGTCYVYGVLSGQPVGNISGLDLIYRRKQVRGFMVRHWIVDGGNLRALRRLRWAASLVNPGMAKGGWAETNFADCRMENMHEEFLKMWNTDGFTGAKLRVHMD